MKGAPGDTKTAASDSASLPPAKQIFVELLRALDSIDVGCSEPVLTFWPRIRQA